MVHLLWQFSEAASKRLLSDVWDEEGSRTPIRSSFFAPQGARQDTSSHQRQADNNNSKIQFIKDEFTRRIGEPLYTGTISLMLMTLETGVHKGQWTRPSFPWMTLVAELLRMGIYILNYPEDVPFPGTLNSAAGRSSKGIAVLSSAERSRLASALQRDGHQLAFLKMGKGEKTGS
jgi:hypothetical protein